MRALVPRLSIALAGVLIGVASGQALGPVLAGTIAGSAGITVEQTITVDTDFDIQDTGVSAGFSAFNGFLGLANDEGTSFMVAIETWNGHVGEFSIPIANHGNVPANAVLTLTMSPGIEVEIDADSGDIYEALRGPGEWLILAEPVGGNIYVTVHPRDVIQPGFYSITGRIVQVAG